MKSDNDRYLRQLPFKAVVLKGGKYVFYIIEEKYAWRPGSVFVTHKPDTIVIHHALHPNCTAQDIHRWHLDNGWKGIAYHYYIRKNGLIYRGRQEQHEGGHLLGSENKNTLGICLEGVYTDYKTLTEKSIPDVQMAALVWLCNDIKTRWEIKAIKRHADYPSAKQESKDCPGKYFPWEKFMSMMADPNSVYKYIIQKNCNFSHPEGVWKVVDTHPYFDAFYMQWANSYKTKTPG